MRLNLKDKNRKKSVGFSYAWNGIVEMCKSERNFRLHLLATFLVVIAGILLCLSKIEWMILIVVIGMVLVAETTNTAVEKLIDFLRPDIHPMAKIIKDIAAGSVLIAAIMAFIIGCILFIPKLYHIFI
ncbi:diacylglycerol kinase [Virgibacillus phasianinus]|uniref:Diacylglycerol kinase n=1 Tax=Virgibacillus phasianinus TaxID=2017483 RepID=A0A220U4R9_9BACI|nr:diacylglycerol kinase family protein [Virgibacillus phasianinus]ASK63158.1 diacylglycerol kinase [Virgibacillus phasianinus]